MLAEARFDSAKLLPVLTCCLTHLVHSAEGGAQRRRAAVVTALDQPPPRLQSRLQAVV